MEVITADTIQKALKHFTASTYTASAENNLCVEALQLCQSLFSKDYTCHILSNDRGRLSSHYPRDIIIPICEVSASEEERNERNREFSNLRELVVNARNSRCRTRFVVPSILYGGNYVCRSSTLSSGPELYGRLGMDFFGNSSESSADKNGADNDFDVARTADMKLLRSLCVRYICDLMVEKKKVKFGLYVASSEKADKEKRYSEFALISLPYPGCEFFQNYGQNNYSDDGLAFDWSQPEFDADLSIPTDFTDTEMGTDWKLYKSWNLVTMTQNYLRLLLNTIRPSRSGLLIHCVSGWDRTPLFVSLIRLSLWSDGLVHKSLNVFEITYLTLVYDWLLFGHQFQDRLSRGEEILFFCFDVLPNLSDERFSLASACSLERQRRLNEVRNVFIPIYESAVGRRNGLVAKSSPLVSALNAVGNFVGKAASKRPSERSTPT